MKPNGHSVHRRDVGQVSKLRRVVYNPDSGRADGTIGAGYQPAPTFSSGASSTYLFTMDIVSPDLRGHSGCRLARQPVELKPDDNA